MGKLSKIVLFILLLTLFLGAQWGTGWGWGQYASADVKVFLEGPYSGGSMTTTLNSEGYIPLTQPYNTAPWNYPGTESVSGIPSGVTDWVLLELRSTTTTIKTRRAAFLKSDGQIVDLDGSSPVRFAARANFYYVVVWHRNHLAIMSATAILLKMVPSQYDFSTGQNKAYGTDPMKDLGSGVFGMIGGDADLDSDIDQDDWDIILEDRNKEGYLYTDINLNGITTIADNNICNDNFGKNTKVP